MSDPENLHISCAFGSGESDYGISMTRCRLDHIPLHLIMFMEMVDLLQLTCLRNALLHWLRVYSKDTMLQYLLMVRLGSPCTSSTLKVENDHSVHLLYLTYVFATDRIWENVYHGDWL